MYLSMYHLPRICCTLVPEICVCPEMLHVFQYIDVLTCMIYNYMHLTEQQRGLELLVSAVSGEDYRRKQVGECADTWYKLRIQPTETVEL